MPLGLNIAPGMFERVMDVLVTTRKWQFDLDYLEDNVVFLRTPDKHIELVSQVLNFLSHKSVKLNLNKCVFFINLMDYPGHFMHPGRLEVWTRTIYAVQRLESPISLKEL